MERIYRGLVWVAGAAVVAGAMLTSWVVWVANNQSNYISFTHFGWNVSDPNAWSNYVALELPTLLQSAALDFLLGVAVVAAVVAWADCRYRWMAALTALTLAALIAPLFLSINNPLFYTHPRLSLFLENNGVQLAYFIRILPSALAIVMARTSPTWGKSLKQARAQADAEIGITRSRL